MHLKNYFLLLSILFSWSNILAQKPKIGLTPAKKLNQFSLEQWTSEKGLPSNNINDIIQTSDGYVWVSTYNGICKFDGETFTVFDNTKIKNIETSVFYSSIEDPEGNLLVGTPLHGILKYKNGKFTTLVEVPGFSISTKSILVDKNKQIWVGTINDGAYKVIDGKFEKVDHPTINGVNVHDIIQDNKGDIWFATEGKGITKLEGGQFKNYTVQEGLASNKIYDLYEDDYGNVWVGTINGVCKIENGVIKNFPYLKGTDVNRIIEDSYNNIWLATNSGLVRINGLTNKFEFFSERYDLPSFGFNAICFDKEGSLWIGGNRGGLYRMKDGNFINFTEKTGLASNATGVVYELEKGKFLVGTDVGKVNIIENNKVSELKLKTVLPKIRIRDFLKDKKGNLWIASYAGLIKINGRKEYFYTPENGLPATQLRKLFEDNKGNIWVGTRDKGLIKILENGSFELFDKTKGLGSDFIMSLSGDQDGNLIVGTNGGGLNIIDQDENVKKFTTADGITGDVIFNTLTEPNGTIWICTNGGINRLRDGKIDVYNKKSGLPIDTFFDILEDENGFFWFPSFVGIIKIHKEHLNQYTEKIKQTLEFKVYDKNDGMPSSECIGATTSLKTSDGMLWFHTYEGLCNISPGKLSYNTIKPPVFISKITVDNKKLDIDKLIVLPATSRKINFDFTALSLLAPNKVKFKYKLEGYDNDWSTPQTKRNILYTNLPYGDYTFKVIACNNDNVWNDKGATLKFYKEPHFYENAFFYVAMAILLVGAWIGVYKWRTRYINRRNKVLSALVKKRTEQISYQKEEIEVQKDNIENQNIELKIQAQKLSDANKDILDKNKTLNKQKEEMTLQARELQQVNDSLTTMNYLLEKQKVSLHQTNMDLEDANEKILNQKKEIEEKSAAIGTINYLLKQQNKELRLQADELEEAKNDIEYKNTQLAQKKEEIEAQKDNIEEKSNSLQKIYDQIKEKNHEIEVQKNLLERNNKKLEEAKQIISTKNDELQIVNNKLEEKVQKRTLELKNAYHELLLSNKELDHFIYRTAHDLKGPITRLLGLCYAGSLEFKDEGVAVEYLDMLNVTSSEMNQKLGKLMRVHDFKKEELHIESFNLKDLITDILKKYQLSEPDINKVKISDDTKPDTFIASDKKLINILLENIIQNSIRYYDSSSKKESYVNIRTNWISATKLIISVIDNGIGIPDEIGDSIFDMFVVATEQPKGPGLGLYEVKVIIKKLGGEISFNSDDSETVFQIILPSKTSEINLN